MKTAFLTTTVALALMAAACTDELRPAKTTDTVSDTTATMEIAEEDASYTTDTTSALSFIAYDKSRSGPRPVVLIIPEWWGLNDYAKMRAREMAKLGYFAMAVDMFGQRRVGQNPEEAGKLAMPFYGDTALVRSRLTAALNKAVSYPQANKESIGMMGYCFGGSMSLWAAKLGLPLKGVISFHGGLKGTAGKNAPVLICHGEADKMVSPEEVAVWRKSMDSLGAQYTFKSYPGATHAFTNPEATANGKKFGMPIEYNAAADTASWNEMKLFFGKVLPVQ